MVACAFPFAVSFLFNFTVDAAKDWLLLLGCKLSHFLLFLLNQTASPQTSAGGTCTEDTFFCKGASIGRDCNDWAPPLVFQISEGVGCQLEINVHNQLWASPARLPSITFWLLWFWLLKGDLSYLQRPYFHQTQDCDAHFLMTIMSLVVLTLDSQEFFIVDSHASCLSVF